jgi:hypothetical protein
MENADDNLDPKANAHEGELLYARGKAVVWHINGGIRWGVPSKWLYSEIAPDRALLDVPVDVLERFPRIPKDRTLLQERPSSRIVMVIDGKRFWLSPGEFERLNLWGKPLIEVHEALLGILPDGGLYRKKLDRSSHRVARLLRAREKYRLDTRAFIVGVLSGVAVTLIIKAF